MKYSCFKELDNILLEMIKKLKFINSSQEFVVVKLGEKHRYSSVMTGCRGDLINYNFLAEWFFPRKYQFVYNVEVKDYFLLDRQLVRKFLSDDIIDSSCLEDDENADNLFLEKYKQDEFFWKQFSKDDSATLINSLMVNYVDNPKAKVIFDSNIGSNLPDIDFRDLVIFAKLDVNGVDTSIRHGSNYRLLLAEAVTHYFYSDEKVSYFIAFTALENYLNFVTESTDWKKSVLDKLLLSFMIRFCPANESHLDDPFSHEIFNSVEQELRGHIKTRNRIAHGGNVQNIDVDDCKELLILALVIITTFENKIMTFKELKTSI